MRCFVEIAKYTRSHISSHSRIMADDLIEIMADDLMKKKTVKAAKVGKQRKQATGARRTRVSQFLVK